MYSAGFQFPFSSYFFQGGKKTTQYNKIEKSSFSKCHVIN